MFLISNILFIDRFCFCLSGGRLNPEQDLVFKQHTDTREEEEDGQMLDVRRENMNETQLHEPMSD